VCSKNAYGSMPFGALKLPLPQSTPSMAALPKTRGKSVKELTGMQVKCSYDLINVCLVNEEFNCGTLTFIIILSVTMQVSVFVEVLWYPKS